MSTLYGTNDTFCGGNGHRRGCTDKDSGRFLDPLDNLWMSVSLN